MRITGKSGIGFYYTRPRSLQRLRRFFCVLVLCALLLVVGMTRLWSQSSDILLSNSGNTLTAWSGLYSQGLSIYEEQKRDLEVLKQEILNLESGYCELMNLSEQLSRSNADLRLFNSQIGERLRERDNELYRAYKEIDVLLVQRKHLTIISFVLLAMLAGALILIVFRMRWR